MGYGLPHSLRAKAITLSPASPRSALSGGYYRRRKTVTSAEISCSLFNVCGKVTFPIRRSGW
jgi:hypothetical protein